MASTETLSKMVSAVFTHPPEPLVNIEMVEISSETSRKLSESVVRILSSWHGTELRFSGEPGNSKRSNNG